MKSHSPRGRAPGSVLNFGSGSNRHFSFWIFLQESLFRNLPARTSAQDMYLHRPTYCVTNWSVTFFRCWILPNSKSNYIERFYFCNEVLITVTMLSVFVLTVGMHELVISKRMLETVAVFMLFLTPKRKNRQSLHRIHDRTWKVLFVSDASSLICFM